MFIHKMGWIFQNFLYPSLTWSRYTDEATLYLTFDDGPIPHVTEFVLDILKSFDAKATFFCVGENVQKHPEIFNKLIDNGHSVGNHTFNHLVGWNTDDTAYFQNIEKAHRIMQSQKASKSQNLPLFRPPHGRIKLSQIKKIKQTHEIIMWDVLSGDFSSSLPPEICLKKSIQYSHKGSIIVFHDSLKAQKNLYYVLPKFLEHFANKGFSFKSL